MKFLLYGFLLIPSSAWSDDLESSLWRDRQSLRLAIESASGTVNNLIRTALEKEKISYLKGLVDQSAAASATAYQAAQSMDAQCENAFASMKMTVEGGHDSPAPDKVLNALSASAAEDKNSLQNLQQETPVSPHADNPSAASMSKNASDLLNEIKDTLADVDAKLKTMADDAERMRNLFRQESSVNEEMRKAFGDISRAAPKIPLSAADTKARFDALGTEPETEQRTKASQKLDDFHSLISALYIASDILSHRTDNFGHGWSDFQKPRAEFWETQDRVTRKLQEAHDDLAKARQTLDRIQSLR